MAVNTPKTVRERWNELDPARKKQIMIGLTILGVVLVAWIIVSSGSTGPSMSRTAQGKIENALMPVIVTGSISPPGPSCKACCSPVSMPPAARRR